MTFQKKLAVLSLVLFSAIFSSRAQAVEGDEITESSLAGVRPVVTMNCPAPSEVKCMAQSVGDWTQNGGYKVNTAFVPNNQCANVIKINENGFSNRLMCCYNDCGVLYKDVKFKSCSKLSTSEFHCQ